MLGLFLMGAWTTGAYAQGDLQLLRQAHDQLYNCRMSFNLSPAYLDSCLARANQQIKRVPNQKTLLKKDPVGVFKYNAEYGYLSFINGEFNQQASTAENIKMLERTYKYIKKAREKYMAAGGHSFISKESIDILHDEIKSHLGKYDLLHLVEEGQFADMMPKFTPYPYSAMSQLSRDKISGNSLGDIDDKLSRILDQCGYDERSYFYYPNGFALVTQMEQINKDGSPRKLPHRWSSKTSVEDWSLLNYLKALFTASPSSYRIFAFVVSDHPITLEESTRVDMFVEKTVINRLPQQIRNLNFGPDHNVTVLIYEFQRKAGDQSVRLTNRSALTGKAHLKQSRILDYAY
ncbi:MAG: hypothetical protein AAFP19_03195 [Bacteroidota bacterium]